MGSLNEVEYYLLLARDLTFVTAAQHSELSAQLREARRLLSGLVAKLKDRKAVD
jgi:four helix bundle protein